MGVWRSSMLFCVLSALTPLNPDKATAVTIVRRALGSADACFKAQNTGLEGETIVTNVLRRRQQVEKNDRIGYSVMSEQYKDMVLVGIIGPGQGDLSGAAKCHFRCCYAPDN